jgi:hypothetical protein
VQAIQVALEKMKITGTDSKISNAAKVIFKYLFLTKSTTEKINGTYKTK